jgi:hypothetical protein
VSTTEVGDVPRGREKAFLHLLLLHLHLLHLLHLLPLEHFHLRLAYATVAL